MSFTKFTSRQTTNCQILGAPRELGGTQLPTVMRCCLEIRRVMGVEFGGNREIIFNSIADATLL